MAQQVFGPAAVVSVLNRAFTNTSPSNAVFNNQLAQAGTTEASQYAFAESFGATFAVGKTAAELSALVMANMGLDNQLLADALTDYITVHGTNKIGIIAYQLGTLLSPLENDATYGAAAKAWNAEVTAAYEYSADPSNTVPSTSDTNGNEAGKSFVLTTGQDVRTGTSGADFFRGVAGTSVNNQDQTTLNSSDILDGGLGQDTLVLLLNGLYGGGARIKGIETLQLGTNNTGLAAPAIFDYNVNAGQNEITEVATIVYDQINQGETLTVRNILKTGDVIPTLAWKNEAGSQAGIVAATYRASAVAGATDQAVELHNVMAVNGTPTTGRLDIDAGVETLTITSTGTTANTLNFATNNDGNQADLVSTGLTDNVADNGALTKVVVKGDQAFGRAATVVTNDVAGEASFGLTNRAVGNDVGLLLNNTQASASNLISVAGTVTEIDATEADGGVAMRFVGRNDGAAVNVKFTGGKAADYIEFERGNVNASGGEGNDTFAFVNNNLTSFDFGSADTIVGGAGVDTIQLGVNGAGSVVANTTEFNNKTGIDVLDLRGAVNNVTLADAFVAGADAGTFTVRTDKIYQTSATSTANTAPSNVRAADNAANVALENNSVNTIVLTELADNRAIEFIGGSGSDRVVVDNASANQFTKLDGGTNAAAGSNDSLTVVNTSVLDSNDVANIKGFEFLNLVDSTSANSRFDITISEAFLLANSTTTKALTIGSVNNTYGNALVGGADQVFLEVGDLFTDSTATAVKASLAGRVVNVHNLQVTNGLTPTYMINGVQATAAQLAVLTAAGNIVATTATADAAEVLNDVPGAVPAVAATTRVLTAGALNSGTAAADNFATTQANLLAAGTVVDGLAGVDTLTLTDAATVALTSAQLAGRVFNTETLALGNFANALTLNGAASSIQNITGNALADTVTLAGATALATPATGTFNNIDLGAGADALSLGGVTIATGSALSGGAGIDTLTLTAGQTLSGVTVTGFEIIDLANQTLTINRADLTQYTASADRVIQRAAGVTFADTGAATAVAEFATYTLANGGVNNFTSTLATAVTVNGGNGANFITTGAGADIIVGGAGNDVITGGAGNDSITVGGGDDVIKFAATAAANGQDSIKDFLVAGTDKLDFTAFLGGAADAVTTAINIQTGTPSVLGTKNVAVVFNDADGALASGDFQTTTTAGKIAIEDNSKAVILVSADADGTSDTTVTAYNIYYVEDTDTGTGQTWAVTLVGTLDNTTELSAAALAAAAVYA